MRQHHGFKEMTPDDIISTFQLFEESKANATKHLAMHGTSTSKINLALKAKHECDEEESEEEEGDDDCEDGDDVDSDESPSYEDIALFVKNFSAGKFKGRFPKKKVRKCYNCEETNHFSNDCPYEKREDKPRFPKTFVKKKLPNPMNSKLKRTDGRAMVAQEESDPEDVGGVAGVAQDTQSTLRLVNKSGDVVHYNYMKDYKGNAHKCLMAKTAMGDEEDQSSHDKVKVTPRLNSFSLASTPSDEYLDAEDHYEDNDLDHPMFAKINKFMCSLKGKKLTMFRILMEMVSKHTNTIKELETLVTEEKERNEILEQKVLYEEAQNDALCSKVGENLDKHANDLASLKKAESVCKELLNDKDRLVNSHASLSKDCERLSLSLKDKEEKLTVLTKSFEALKVTYLDTLAQAYSSPIINVDTCTTNSSSELTSILEENCSLKAQLDRGLMTCAQGQKTLNEILSRHNGGFGEEGLGFNPITAKKSASPLKCTTPLKEIFVREGHKEKGKVVSGSATRGSSTHNKTTEFMPPSYVLRKSKEGEVYAKFVGPRNAFRFYAIWVPKTLVTNVKGPMTKWVPQTKS